MSGDRAARVVTRVSGSVTVDHPIYVFVRTYFSSFCFCLRFILCLLYDFQKSGTKPAIFFFFHLPIRRLGGVTSWSRFGFCSALKERWKLVVEGVAADVYMFHVGRRGVQRSLRKRGDYKYTATIGVEMHPRGGLSPTRWGEKGAKVNRIETRRKLFLLQVVVENGIFDTAGRYYLFVFLNVKATYYGKNIFCPRICVHLVIEIDDVA